MQVKPRFDKYSFIEQHSIIKDDCGNDMCLTLLEVFYPKDEYEIQEEGYKFWTVIGRNREVWGNKAIGYEGVAFWNNKKRDLLTIKIKDFIITEINNGEHNLFDKDKQGLRTIFKIEKIK